MTPRGEPLEQRTCNELASLSRLVLVCGHYEGFDERCFSLADRCISIGDYVLTGGELPAMVLADAVVRQIPGVLGNEESPAGDSYSDGLDGMLEYPQYTRPASYRGMDVPDVLLSGDHARIREWRKIATLETTKRLRPDLLR
jgi:tRNA (guanine37-N1)-methyltransferase